MRKAIFSFILIILFTYACSNTSSKESIQNTITPLPSITGSKESHQKTITSPPHATNTTPINIDTPWPPVTGPAPSYRVGAFYYPWYFNLESDGRWVHWDQGDYKPPLDIASDFYPVLGAYSVSDPTVLAQHFAWLRESGVGIIISSWWGQGESSDRILRLMFDIADHYGIKIAFHIEPYGARTAESLADDIQYIYDRYGNYPAFFWTTETSCFSLDDRPKGLFFIWASAVPDGNSPVVSPDYWQETIDTIHNKNPGAIILTDQNDSNWINHGHFDGSYNYGVLDVDQVGYKWALNLPAGAWYVPGINPGFSARRIGYANWVDTPRMNGSTYDDRWEQMFAVGIEPKLVVITTFNEWHEGTQIEPAAPGVTTPNGFTYQDYGKLPPDGYLTLTREWSERFLTFEWPRTITLRVRMQTTSDWTDLNLIEGAIWHDTNVISTSGDEAEAGMLDGYFNLQQPIGQAESGNITEVIFEIKVRDVENENSVVFEIERGGLGATWVELYRLLGEEWIMVESFSWGGHSEGDRNTSSFEVTKETIFGELK
ncbi:MAG: hypothetical protein U9R53_00400 [Chloroflexota bacterium]|nr:hypothetical protein [Chloroflexota bacterium]